MIEQVICHLGNRPDPSRDHQGIRLHRFMEDAGMETAAIPRCSCFPAGWNEAGPVPERVLCFVEMIQRIILVPFRCGRAPGRV